MTVALSAAILQIRTKSTVSMQYPMDADDIAVLGVKGKIRKALERTGASFRETKFDGETSGLNEKAQPDEKISQTHLEFIGISRVGAFTRSSIP